MSVVGPIAGGNAYTVQEERKMSKFMQYAMAATQEALDDARWHPQEEHQKEMTVEQVTPGFSTRVLTHLGRLLGLRYW